MFSYFLLHHAVCITKMQAKLSILPNKRHLESQKFNKNAPSRQGIHPENIPLSRNLSRYRPRLARTRIATAAAAVHLSFHLSQSARRYFIRLSADRSIGTLCERGCPTYDVHTEGGRGVPSKADIVSNLRKGGCVNLRTRGRGSKNPKFLRTYLMEAPYPKT